MRSIPGCENYSYATMATKIYPYDGRKRLLTDGFDGTYMLVYRPVAGSSWSSDGAGGWPSKPPNDLTVGLGRRCKALNLTTCSVSRLKTGATSQSRRGSHHDIMLSITVRRHLLMRCNPFRKAATDFLSLGFAPFDKAIMDYLGTGRREVLVHHNKRIKS